MGRIFKSDKTTLELGGAKLRAQLAVLLSFSATVTNGYHPVKGVDGANYVVPAGFKLRLYAHNSQINGTTGVGMGLGYGDTAAPGTTSAPTTPVSGPGFFSGVSSVPANAPVFWEIPAGKYPYVLLGSAGTVYGRLLGELIKV